MLVIPTKERMAQEQSSENSISGCYICNGPYPVVLSKAWEARCLDLRGLDRRQFFAITECYHDREDESQECLTYVRAIVNRKEGSVMVNAGAMLNFLVDRNG